MKFELNVDFADLRGGLHKFKIPRRIRKSDKASIAFDGQYCSIEAFDVAVVARATGIWPGVAHFNPSAIVALVQVPPRAGPFIIRMQDELLKLGPTNIYCDWQPVSHALLSLPATPDWMEALSVKYRATRAQIIAGGLKKDIAKAERKLDALLAKAAKVLAPVGVNVDDLRALVEEKLAER